MGMRFEDRGDLRSSPASQAAVLGTL